MTNELMEQAAFDTAQTGYASSEKYLTFFVDEQLYSIPSSEVIEIIQIEQVTYMPNVPDFVKGVINIRGKVVPLIDLRLRLKQGSTEYDDKTCIVVVESGDMIVGFIVDRVNDVTDILADQISPPPRVSNKDHGNDFISGIAKFGQSVAMILDVSKILADGKFDIA